MGTMTEALLRAGKITKKKADWADREESQKSAWIRREAKEQMKRGVDEKQATEMAEKAYAHFSKLKTDEFYEKKRKKRHENRNKTLSVHGEKSNKPGGGVSPAKKRSDKRRKKVRKKARSKQQQHLHNERNKRRESAQLQPQKNEDRAPAPAVPLPRQQVVAVD